MASAVSSNCMSWDFVKANYRLAGSIDKLSKVSDTAERRNRYYVFCRGRRYYVGERHVQLLKVLAEQAPRKNAEATAIFQDIPSPDDALLQKQVIDTLLNAGLVRNEAEAESLPAADLPSAPPELLAAFTLLTGDLAGWIASWFAWLYEPVVAVAVLGATMVAMYLAAVRFPVFFVHPFELMANISQSFSLADYFVFYAMLLGSSMFHELGHTAAARRQGESVGKIGFGFYYVFPVFFADVSDTWSLDRVGRIIVNLGGIYFQALFVGLMALLFGRLHSGVVAAVVLVTLVSIVGNLNPFLKFDGYWVLADLLDSPRLSRLSNQLGLGIYRGLITLSSQSIGLLRAAVREYGAVVTSYSCAKPVVVAAMAWLAVRFYWTTAKTIPVLAAHAALLGDPGYPLPLAVKNLTALAYALILVGSAAFAVVRLARNIRRIAAPRRID